MMMTVKDFNARIEAGPWAWPGGYPVFFVTGDGCALSFDAAKVEAERIRESITSRDNDGWRVVAANINWEDDSLYCDHTGQRIESAYAEPA